MRFLPQVKAGTGTCPEWIIRKIGAMSALPPDIPTAAADIVAQLQETHPPAILQIRRIVE